MSTWLMKSEPTEYSIDDLQRDGRSSWFGVRNYLARNYMRDQMQIGDRVLFYHSSCSVPGIYGVGEVVSAPHPDMTQYDNESKYYDPTSTIEAPRWYCVDIGYVAHTDHILTIRDLREIPGLESLKILQKGNRLSITSVTDEEYSIIHTYSHI